MAVETKEGRKMSESFERLTAFLYILMRDHLPSGTVEKIMMDHVDVIIETPVYSNQHLVAHAREIADRIMVVG